jgi:hypothetical protein
MIKKHRQGCGAFQKVAEVRYLRLLGESPGNPPPFLVYHVHRTLCMYSVKHRTLSAGSFSYSRASQALLIIIYFAVRT